MTTTFEKYVGTKRHNYCTLPEHDVEILPDVRHCKKCGGTVIYDSKKGAFGGWKHEGNAGACPDGYVAPKTQCRYCHSEAAVYRQHAWFDAVECPRCGAVDGHAIGD